MDTGSRDERGGHLLDEPAPGIGDGSKCLAGVLGTEESCGGEILSVPLAEGHTTRVAEAERRLHRLRPSMSSNMHASAVQAPRPRSSIEISEGQL